MASAVLMMEVGWGGKRRSPSKMHHSSLGKSRQDQRRSLSINLGEQSARESGTKPGASQMAMLIMASCC